MWAGSLILLFALHSLCPGSEISGIWGLNARNPTLSTAIPVAIRIDQTGDRLSVLKIMKSLDGRYLEYRDYVIPHDAEIHFTLQGTEIRLSAPAETWIIDPRGALTISRPSDPQLVLTRAGKFVHDVARGRKP